MSGLSDMAGVPALLREVEAALGSGLKRFLGVASDFTDQEAEAEHLSHYID